MGIESLLLCSIFIKPTDDIPLYGTSEIVERNRLYQKSNNVGTSGYQTFLTDPQPAPFSQVSGPGLFERIDIQKPVPQAGSFRYVNYAEKPLGGILNLNPEEFEFLVTKLLEQD